LHIEYYKVRCDRCADDLVSESGVTDVHPRTIPTATAHATYVPPDPSTRVDSTVDSRSEYCDAYTGVLPHSDKAVSHRSPGTASAASSAAFQSTVSAGMTASGGAVMQTLPKLELKEQTLVSIIEVQLPWLFWVQRHSKEQQLEDILDKLEYVDHC